MTIKDNVKAVASLVSATRTSAANGSAVDTLGYSNAALLVQAGDIDLANANETYVFTVEESADGTTGWTAIDGVSVAVTADNQTSIADIGGVGNSLRKRYLRAVLTTGGTTPSIPASATILLGQATRNPVA